MHEIVNMEEVVVALNKNEDEVGVEFQAETMQASAVRAISIGVGPNEDNDDENVHGNEETNNNNNNNITHNEQQQQQPPPPPPPAPHSQRHHVAIGVPLTRAYLAGIPPAKPYRRVTYTEWSPSPSSSSSSSLSPESIAITLQSVQDVEKKVKTCKCRMISCLLSMACYTICFLIVPFLIYLSYVIYYIVQMNQQEAIDAGETPPLPGADDTNSLSTAIDEIDAAVPCPYVLKMRDKC